MKKKKSNDKNHHSEKELIKKINESYKVQFNSENTSTEYALQIGRDANRLKTIVKENGAKWQQYVENNFPDIPIRRMEKYMRMAKEIKIDKYPSLATAGQERLLKLISKAKIDETDVVAFLEDNDISLDFDHESIKSAKLFVEEIDEALSQQSNSSGKDGKPPFEKSAKSLLDKIEALFKIDMPTRKKNRSDIIMLIEKIEKKLAKLKKELTESSESEKEQE